MVLFIPRGGGAMVWLVPSCSNWYQLLSVFQGYVLLNQCIVHVFIHVFSFGEEGVHTQWFSLGVTLFPATAIGISSFLYSRVGTSQPVHTCSIYPCVLLWEGGDPHSMVWFWCNLVPSCGHWYQLFSVFQGQVLLNQCIQWLLILDKALSRGWEKTQYQELVKTNYCKQKDCEMQRAPLVFGTI